MKLKNNQEGVAHLAAILAVVVVIAIGVVGWKVWDSRTSNKNETKAGSPAESSSYLDIKEWGVRMKANPSLGKVSYKYDSSSDSITVTSDLQKTLSAECEYATKSPWGVSRISIRTATEKPDAYPGYTKKIGLYVYKQTYPQTGCESDADTMDKLDMGFAETYETLK